MDDDERTEPGADGPADLWRSDEGPVVASEPRTNQTEPRSLWREEEGTRPRAPIGLAPRSDGSDLWAPTELGREGDAGPQPPPEPLDPSSKKRRRRTEPHQRGWPQRAAILLPLLALLVLAADGTFVALGIRRDLLAIGHGMERARELLGEGDLEAAGARLTMARDHARHASQLTERPAFVIASLVPGVDQETDVVQAVINAGERSVDAGLSGLAALEILDIGTEGVPAGLYSEGQVNLEAVRAVEPHLRAGRDHLSSAQSVLGGDLRSRIPPLTDAVESARNQIADVHQAIARADLLMALLPDLLGGSGQRRYLLAFQALGEARGTGGLIGTFGIIAVDEGATELEAVAPIARLIPTPTVDAPSWFERAYAPLSALKQPQQVNLTPHFPTAAEVFLRMYEAKTNQTADGVIALDPVALASMLEGTGPIQAKGLDKVVSTDNAAEVLLHDSYADIEDSEAQSAYIVRLVDEFWKKIQSGDLDDVAFAKGVGEAVRTGHFKIYSRDKDEQERLVALDAADDFTSLGPNVQLAFVNNFGVNKLDYFLKRDIDTEVAAGGDGSLTVSTEVTLTNTTPEDVDAGLLGPSGRTSNTAQVAVLVPQHATDVAWTVDGGRREEFTYWDNGYPVVWDVLRISTGDASTVAVTYVVPRVAVDELRFVMVPQTAVEPAAYSLHIGAGSGYELESDSIRVSAGTIELKGLLEAPLSVRFSVAEEN